MTSGKTTLVHFSEPEARALLSERAQARELEYLAGQIGEAAFLRSLMIYGYSQADARHALWKLQAEECGL